MTTQEKIQLVSERIILLRARIEARTAGLPFTAISARIDEISKLLDAA